MTPRLTDRVAVVTGAGGGLGGATALRFAEEGATVVVSDVDVDAAERVAEACRASASTSVAIECDVSDSASVGRLFDDVRDRFGRVDVLATIAGISVMSQIDAANASGAAGAAVGIPVNELTDAQWREMLGVHLDGTFYCIRAAVPMMRPGSAIVCMASIASLAGIGPFHYSAAKGGIQGLVRALARDLGPSGIRINAVCPGSIFAGMTLRHDTSKFGDMSGVVPLGRMGEAVDIANAFLHLACDESAYTTGQWLSPNGGMVIA
jgi:3-oxoacyl-[acyl-carrier protein] reductase